MTINDKIRDEKLQYNINKEAAKNIGITNGKIDKYEYKKGKKYYLPSKAKLENKPSLYIPFLGKLTKNKEKLFRIRLKKLTSKSN